MKNKPFHQRLRFALRGIKIAWNTESSFRSQVIMGFGAIGLCIYLKPEPLWWAIILLIVGAVLAAELINTALEKTLDLLHPEMHPLVAQAKDCAAGAVLTLSLSALGILIALIYNKIK